MAKEEMLEEIARWPYTVAFVDEMIFLGGCCFMQQLLFILTKD